jgi:beta-lactamase regulating signal transducer with metallopeptidase domain
MNLPTAQNLVPCLGWTLVHFLWQGLAIAVWLMICLRVLRAGSANQRYLADCAALAAMVLAPVITFNHLSGKFQSQPPALVADFAPTVPAETLRSDAALGPRIVVPIKVVPIKMSLPERLERNLPWLVIAWAVGVFALSGRLLMGWLQVRQLTRTAAIPLEGLWKERLAELANRLRVSQPVRLLQSALVEVPTVIGWLRPVILLPASCLAGLTMAQLEAVLAHELAHIRRHDYLVNLLQSAVETLLFYHPAVWWVSRCIREEREHCCDDLAVRTCGDRVAYARALATLEELRLAPPQLVVAAGGAPLLERIRRLAGRSDKEVGRSGWLVAAMLCLTAVAALTIAFRSSRALAEEKRESNLVTKTPATLSNTNQSPIHSAMLLLHGELLLEDGKLDEAEEKLREMPADDPKAPRAAFLLERVKQARVARAATITSQNKDPLAPTQGGSIGEQVQLFTRVFHVDLHVTPDTLHVGFGLSMGQPPSYTLDTVVRTNTDAELQAEVLRFFTAVGVDFSPTNPANLGKAIFYNHLKKHLMVHATAKDLDIIAATAEALYAVPTEDFTKPTAGLTGWSIEEEERLAAEKARSEAAFHAAMLVQEGRGLFEIGELDGAEAKLEEAKKLEPQNVAARYYLMLISDKRLTTAAGKTELKGGNGGIRDLLLRPKDSEETTQKNPDDPLRKWAHQSPNLYALPLPHIAFTGNGRQNILRRLDGIRVGSVKYDGLPLTDVVKNLNEQAKSLDPEKIGIPFLISSGKATNSAQFGVDPLTGLPVEQFSVVPVEMGTVRVKLNPALKDVKLADLLSAIVKAADQPIKFVIEDHAVIFSATSEELVQLYTRVFHVDPDKFRQGLESARIDRSGSGQGRLITETNNSEELQVAVHQFFTLAGVDFSATNPASTGKSLFLNEHKGTLMLMVRATTQDLDIIGKAIGRLNQSPPQINIKATFVEIDEAANQSNGFNLFLGSVGQNFTSNATTGLPTPPVRAKSSLNVFSDPKHPLTNSVIAQYTGVLTAPQYAVALHALNKRDGVDILSAPQVTTESGRQAVIQIGEMVTVVTGVKPVPKGKVISTDDLITQAMTLGPQLDVIPHALDDGHSIDMTVFATVTEFRGYSDPGKLIVQPGGGKGATTSGLPHYRLRQAGGAQLRVQDGQTLVLGGLSSESVASVKNKTPVLGDVPLLGRLFRSTSPVKTRKNLLVFITPTLINADGTPYNSAEPEQRVK